MNVKQSQAGQTDFFVMARKSHPTPVGSTIRNARLSKGLTLKQAGELSGLKLLAIQRLETSPQANPTVSTLQKLAGALGVSVSELVKDVPVIDPLPIGKEVDE